MKKKRETRGQRNCRWIEEKCVIPEGRDTGKAVKLRKWQRKEICRIYDNPAGTRRAILSFGRKNGKTGLAAFLLLLHLVGPEAVRNSQLYSAAQSREQAAIVFLYAMKCVRLSPHLAPFVEVRESTKRLYCEALGTLYRALSADAATAFGLSPAFIVHDELGQIKGPRSPLYEALETATGAHGEPLSVVISTQAPTEADLLSVLIDDALAASDPRVVVALYTAPMDADPFSLKAIKAANPAYGDFLNAKEVLAMAEDARRMPSREAEYRNLILNQRVEVFSPFVSKSVWDECAGDAEDFGEDELPVYGGLDLSETTDLTSLELVKRRAGIWRTRSTFWLPGDGLEERARKDRVPYDVWAKAGHLIAVPGRAIEYKYVAEYLRDDVFKVHNVAKIFFDRWNMRHLKPWLLEAGFTEEQFTEHFVEFGQGFASMSPALTGLETDILNGRFRHDRSPVLTMCAANAVVAKDPAGNRKLNKAKSRGRIDGMVALTMAHAAGIVSEGTGGPSVYDLLGQANQVNAEELAAQLAPLELDKNGIDWNVLQDTSHPAFKEMARRWEIHHGGAD